MSIFPTVNKRTQIGLTERSLVELTPDFDKRLHLTKAAVVSDDARAFGHDKAHT